MKEKKYCFDKINCLAEFQTKKYVYLISTCNQKHGWYRFIDFGC